MRVRRRSKGYIKKVTSDEDARVVNLSLTEKGMELYTVFVQIHQTELAKILKDVSEEKLLITIETIYKVSEIMKNNRINFKK